MLNSVAAEKAALDAYLARFVPRYRRSLLQQGALPAAATSHGVVLYVDIAGFTALTGELTHNLAVGAEQVAQDVNRVLTAIAQIAARHGGEVMHFAGDAAWIAWLADTPGEVAALCRLAASTAVAVQQASLGWTLGARPVGLRSSIGSGAVDHLEVGGHEGQWIGLLGGAAIADTVQADRYAAPGSIVVSQEVWRCLRGVCIGAEAGGGYMRIEQMRDSRPLPAVSAAAAGGGRLGAFLSPMVLFHAESEQRETWAGEFRTGHVIFARLRDAAAVGQVDRMQAAVAEIQRQFDRADGSLYQVLTDEKGVAVIGVFGLPPHVHAGDAGRALETAVSLETALAQLDFDVHVGVATGRLFCTIYGTGDQLQFALVGPALNLAARLADGREAVVADTDTVDAAGPRHALIARHLPARILKGVAEPVAAFEIYRRSEQATGSALAAPVPRALIGRESELARGVVTLDRLVDGEGGLLIIEGDPGVGKSALAEGLAGEAQGRMLRCLGGAADEIERATDYLPWRPVLRAAASTLSADPPALPSPVLRALGDNQPHAHLLSHILGWDLGNGAGAPPLSDEGRAEIVRRMSIDLLAAAARQAPLVIVLEDMQWFDSASLFLLRELLDAGLPILVVLTRRPDAADDEFIAQLLDGSARQTIVLDGLAIEPTSALLAKVCSASRADDDLAGRVKALTAGNPFFIAEVGRFLLEHGRLRVSNGEVVPVDENVTLDEVFKAFGVPATLEGVVMGRLDSLPPAERETVRVCSVFGRTFEPDDIAALLGRAPNKTDFTGLIAAGVLADDEPGGLGFRHAILRDVAYSSLSMADRKRLHAAAAQRLAGRAAGDGHLDAVLAHHYERAGEFPIAVDYLLRAGATALRNNTNKEALALHEQGLGLLGKLPRQAGFRELEIALDLGAGEAAQRLSRYDDAAQHKDAALAALGGAVPRGAAAVLGIVREVVAQIVRRQLPVLGHRLPRPTPLSLRISAETAELVEIYFYRGQNLRSLYAALRSLNLAEGGGDTPQLARGFGIVGTMAGFARLSGVAESYGQRALDILPRIDDPAAAWWVPLVVGVSRLSAGELGVSAELMEQTAAAAGRIHDRRHWRDAIENLGIIAALRGNWPLALEHIAAYRATAVADKDARYVVAALREQAYCLLRLGRIEECERGLVLLRAELARGVKAEEAASRQDLHAFAAAVAMEKGDVGLARTEVREALAAVAAGSGGTSFPNMFLSLSVLSDVLLKLAGDAGDAAADEWRQRALLVCRALTKHAASHAVGRPAALRAKGIFQLRFGRPEIARTLLAQAAIGARDMGLAHEPGPELSGAARTAILDIAALPVTPPRPFLLR